MQSEPLTDGMNDADPPPAPPPSPRSAPSEEVYTSWAKYGHPRCTAVHPTYGQCEVKQGNHTASPNGDVIHDTTANTWIRPPEGYDEHGRPLEAQDSTRPESEGDLQEEVLSLPEGASFITVKPGDSVLLLLAGDPGNEEMENIINYLTNWEPRVKWQVAVGVLAAVQLVDQTTTESGLIVP